MSAHSQSALRLLRGLPIWQGYIALHFALGGACVELPAQPPNYYAPPPPRTVVQPPPQQEAAEIPPTTSSSAPAPVAPSPPPTSVATVPMPPKDEPDPLIGVTPRALGPSEANILVDALPLQRNDLDFGRIRHFLDLYVAIVAGESPERRASVVAAIRQARIYMREAAALTQGGSVINFSMDGLSANDILAWAKPPYSGSALPLANSLEAVLRQVEQVLQDFRKWADWDRSTMPFFDEQQRTTIQQQVGGKDIPYGSSLASANLDDIAMARDRLPEVLRNPQ